MSPHVKVVKKERVCKFVKDREFNVSSTLRARIVCRKDQDYKFEVFDRETNKMETNELLYSSREDCEKGLTNYLFNIRGLK